MPVPTEEELKAHPHGQISVNGSQQMQSTMAKFSYTNNATHKHTMARSPNGIALGHREASGSLEIDVAEDGLEQDWYRFVKTGQLCQFQHDIPTLNIEVHGVIKDIEAELPSDNGVKLTVNWIGKVLDPVAI